MLSVVHGWAINTKAEGSLILIKCCFCWTKVTDKSEIWSIFKCTHRKIKRVTVVLHYIWSILVIRRQLRLYLNIMICVDIYIICVWLSHKPGFTLLLFKDNPMTCWLELKQHQHSLTFPHDTVCAVLKFRHGPQCDGRILLNCSLHHSDNNGCGKESSAVEGCEHPGKVSGICLCGNDWCLHWSCGHLLHWQG